MPVNKTLYIKDEDAPIWDKARELAGDRLSALLTNYVKQFVASKDAVNASFSRIVLQYRDQGRLPKAQGFPGRWLIAPERPWHVSSKEQVNLNAMLDFGYSYAVALTPKGKIVYFKFKTLPTNTDGTYPWGDVRVFENFQQAAAAHDVPHGLIADAMEIMGIIVEELDV